MYINAEAKIIEKNTSASFKNFHVHDVILRPSS